MKIIKIGALGLSIFILAGSFLACQQQQTVVDEKLKDVKAGPPLQHVQNVAIASDSIPSVKPLQKSGMIAISILEDNRIFQGELPRIAGRIELKENTLHFAPVSGKPLDIRLDLPNGLAMGKIDPTEAYMELRDLSGLEGADQLMRIETKERLLISSIWQVKPDPFSLQLGKGFQITQEPLAADAQQKPGYESVKSFISGPNGRTELVPGKAIDITSGKTTYTCLLEISNYFKPNDPGEDGKEGYILKVALLLKSGK
jgi:hypothetical protein